MTQNQENTPVIHNNIHGVEFIQFSNLMKYDHIVAHCFTTRKGGVSTGECKSLNLGFNRKDIRENVLENYKKISGVLGIDYKSMVLSNQVHGDRIKIVNGSDKGKGIIIESDIKGYDGLITNKRGVTLVTFYADCVSVFLFDPVNRVIAMVHSGWRGTVKQIAARAVAMMRDEFGTKPDDIEAAIGPSIGQCCFEVGNEVYEEFANTLPWSKRLCRREDSEKWFIDLQGIIKQTLINCSFPEEHICVSGICTKCNNDLFFSHRGDKGKTGSLAAIMQLRQDKIC